VSPERLTLKWVSAAESPRFVTLITEYTERIAKLGPLGSSEGLDLEYLTVRLKAVRKALEGRRLRMLFARQAKYRKQGNTYRDLPSDHKLYTELEKTLKEETDA
jgi:hypothetical protein